MKTTRITTGSRLHFGLIEPSPQAAPRQFGGCGLMVDRPAVSVAVTPADEWSANGPGSSRALTFARRFAESLPTGAIEPHRVEIESCPPEHVGLGVGTQLALATARALADSCCLKLTPLELAVRVGRGARSAIGIHGFESGGFLVDGGKRTGATELAPLIVRAEWPADWKVVLFVPRQSGPWTSAVEQLAFERLSPNPDRAGRLCRLVMTELLPALAESDLPAFGDALYEFNRLAGEAFESAQGGPYATAATRDAIAALRAQGIRGTGQSSWGPTCFAIAGDIEEANWHASRTGSNWTGVVV